MPRAPCPRPFVVALAAALATLCVPGSSRRARADPVAPLERATTAAAREAPPSGDEVPPPRPREAASYEDPRAEREAEGDVDADEPVEPARGAGVVAQGQSWLTLAGFSRDLASGKHDLGGMVVLGLALDRMVAGSIHPVADAPSSVEAPLAPAPPPSGPRVPGVDRALARACVAAALRASGLGSDDTSLDALVDRARASAWLPETRMRAMRLLTDASHVATLTTTDGATYYDAVGANLVLELRLTWRLDRLLYAGDELSVERTRMERHEARARVASRTLEALFGWRRAMAEGHAWPPGSREANEAALRESEALATLDVLTGGWFSRQGGAESGEGEGPGEGPEAHEANKANKASQ